MGTHKHGVPRSKRGYHQELLYDPEIPTPTHAERARTLVEGIGIGTLCTLTVEPKGFPYGSFVTYGLMDGSPVFLISELAEHTKNLKGDARASLLVAESGDGDPLARGRVTLVGECAQVDGDEQATAREAYLAAQPQSAYYVDFKDFSFWKLGVQTIRYIGGYGRMSWVENSDWSASVPDPIATAAGRIISHMNNDHAETMVLYCKAFSKADDTTEAQMTGVDRYGFEMSAHTGQGPRPIRLAFAKTATSATDVRKELVELAKRARVELGLPPREHKKTA